MSETSAAVYTSEITCARYVSAQTLILYFLTWTMDSLGSTTDGQSAETIIITYSFSYKDLEFKNS